MKLAIQAIESSRRRRHARAFTLIELLIVVAIIAILAAIAVPNFLEAQTRSKVARVRADLRTVAMALEIYAVDFNRYPPNDGMMEALPHQLSTPVAYITSTNIPDPFSAKEWDPRFGNLAQLYTYNRIVTEGERQQELAQGIVPPVEAVDAPGSNEGALQKYGKWRLVSVGPDRKYTSADLFGLDDPILLGSDILYDPTNGTVSWGNVLRTHRSPEGILFQVSGR